MERLPKKKKRSHPVVPLLVAAVDAVSQPLLRIGILFFVGRQLTIKGEKKEEHEREN
jgi:hypothetical protein